MQREHIGYICGEILGCVRALQMYRRAVLTAGNHHGGLNCLLPCLVEERDVKGALELPQELFQVNLALLINFCTVFVDLESRILAVDGKQLK